MMFSNVFIAWVIGLSASLAHAAIQHDRPAPDPSLLARLIPYAKLNDAERILVVKNPRAAVVVYFMKGRAEAASAKYFPDQVENDEGDAFRHFVWSGLLTAKLGVKLAKRFLDAHEARPGQSADEERMDRSNNASGQLTARSLIERGVWSQRKLEKIGIRLLRANYLVVLNPRYFRNVH